MEEQLHEPDVTSSLDAEQRRFQAATRSYYDALQACIDALLDVGYSRGFRQQAHRISHPSIQPSPGAVHHVAERKTHRLTVSD